MKYFSLLIIFSLVCHYSQANEQAVITYVRPEGIKDQRSEYFVKLLEMALDKTATQLNDTRLESTINKMKQGRAIHELTKGKSIDIVWTVTSIEREKQLLPIRIPLLKGLLGYRVLIIRKEDRDKFSAVSSKEDLQAYIAGQGHDWPDTSILRANQIDVVTSPDYDGLFTMLQAGRFDVFPRGITEAWQELELQNKPALIIEEHILLYYPSPIYFFVNRDNQLLADRIERGLKMAIEEGAFEQLFNSYHVHQKMFEIARLNQRKVIRLDNHLLPQHTPLKNEQLWYRLKE